MLTCSSGQLQSLDAAYVQGFQPLFHESDLTFRLCLFFNSIVWGVLGEPPWASFHQKMPLVPNFNDKKHTLRAWAIALAP